MAETSEIVFSLVRQAKHCRPGVFVATHVIDALNDLGAARLTLLSDHLVVVTAAVPPSVAVGDLRQRVTHELDGQGWALLPHKPG